MEKFDVNKNKLEIGDVVVLCRYEESISREFEFWEVISDNKFTNHSVFIKGLTTGKTDCFSCDGLKKVDRKYKELVDKSTSKKPNYEGDGCDENGNVIYDTWICPCCETRYEVDYHDYQYCPNCGQKLDWSEE